MRALFFLVVFVLPVGASHGQTIFSRPYETNQLTVETLAPDTPQDAQFPSGALFVTGTLSLSDNIEIAGELPVARYTPSNGPRSTTTAIGNPYLGLGFSSTSVPVFFQLGARLPTAPQNRATAIGRQADVGRLQAFRHEEFVFSGLLNGRLSLGRSTSLRLRYGLAYASYPAPAGASDRRDRDWRTQYEAQIWHEGDRLISGLSLTGRATLTHPGGTQHHATLSVMGNWNRVQPGVIAGTSLNDLVRQGDVSPFVGITLSIAYLRR